MGNNRITSLGTPTDRLDALNKETADNTYIKRGGDNMQGALTMNGNDLTGIPNPSGPLDAANKRWVDSALPDERWHRLVFVKGSPTSHTTDVDDSKVLRVVYRTVGNDIQLGLYFKSDLGDGVYAYDFDIDRGGDRKGVNVLLYGECWGSGYNSKTLYRFLAAFSNANGKDYSVTRDSGQGKRFTRAYGPNVQVHGQFVLRGNDVYNHGKPFSINFLGTNGDTYEFLTQHVTLNTSGATGNKLLGSSLIFVFEPDNNKTTTFLNNFEFKIWKVR